MIRRKVTCVWGELTNESKDFVLEPYFEGDEKYGEICYIEKIEDEVLFIKDLEGIKLCHN